MNKDYWVTYFRLNADVVDGRRFHTMKELCDWMNNNDEAIYITKIEEIPGRKSLDKFYQKV